METSYYWLEDWSNLCPLATDWSPTFETIFQKNCFTFHFDNKVVLNHNYFFISIARTCLIYPVVCVDDMYPDVFHYSYCKISMLNTWYMFACTYLVRSDCDTWVGTGMFSEKSCGALFWVVGFIAMWTIFSYSLWCHTMFLSHIMFFESTHSHILICVCT